MLEEFETLTILENRHMEAPKLLALRTGRLYPAGHTPDINFC
jgi:hypothetical protein